MRVGCPLETALTVAALAAFSATATAQESNLSVQKLLERGALEQAVQRADSERDNPEATYLAAQAAAKMNDSGRVAEQYSRLRESGDEAWKAIAESGARYSDGDLNGAMEAANRAVMLSGDNPYAHYQLGLVASRQNNFARAAEAFTRATDLKPDFAYAHYYAGLTHQRLKHTPKMSEHLETFMRLAPEAPERSAVSAILRTLRPRR